MTQAILKEYRQMTRLALPENDAYIIKLGLATYSFASILTFLLENIGHLDPSVDHSNLSNKEAGIILLALKEIQETREADEITEDIELIIEEFGKFKNLRNDIMHSYCVTGTTGIQILHRSNKEGSFEITEAFLDEFIIAAPDISTRLYKIRDYTWSREK